MTFPGRRFFTGCIVLAAVFISAACNLPRSGENLDGTRAVNTAAAQTVEAITTALAAGGSPNGSGATYTPVSPTRAGTATRVATQPPPPAACNRAAFIEDVSVPDGSSFLPGMPFTKVWLLRNTGSCTWSPDYRLEFANQGSAMSAAPVQAVITSPVAPGEELRAAVQFIAPLESGVVESHWRLRAPSGETFGPALDGGGTIYVRIKVGSRYSFVDDLCSAQWRSAGQTANCPAASEQNKPVLRSNNPKFENDGQDDEPALLMTSPAQNGEETRGTFPAFLVPANARLKAVIGCSQGETSCVVRMGIRAAANGTDQVLGEWEQSYDGSIQSLDIDLASYGLTGMPVSFTFYVRSVSAGSHQVFWLLPRIEP